MKVGIITVGDEILIGQIVDTNSSWIGEFINTKGGIVKHVLSVGDEIDDIVNAMNYLSSRADVVFITGGLGPTNDDITKKAIAQYFGIDLLFDEGTYNRIQRLFEKRGFIVDKSHKQQCFMPSNATLLYNKMGTAPGMWMESENTIFISMPGVPYEMKYICEYEAAPRLMERFSELKIIHKTILIANRGETAIAREIKDIEDSLPKNIKLAYLPGLGILRLRLSAKGANLSKQSSQIEEYTNRIVERLKNVVFGFGKDKLPNVLRGLAVEKNLKIGTAESCTGGKIASLIAAEPGASTYFNGSLIAYNNSVKIDLLEVSEATLETHGAVSEQTVIEMSKGALKKLPIDIVVAVSGIAGPTGGTDEKPVGTIWVCVANKETYFTKKLQLGKDRTQNIQLTANYALDALRKFILKNE